MKKVLLSLMCLWVSIGTFAQFSGSGSGTKDDPYLIFNPIQLDQVRNFLNTSGVYFKLMSDIDLSEYIADNNPTQGWQPIGTSTEPFKGVFEGNGKTVSGMWITRTSTNYVGFWGYLNGATVKNLTLNYSSDCKGKDYVGAFAGYISGGTVSNCLVVAKNITGTTNVGGYVGYNTGSISNSNFNATKVSATTNVGGYAGSNTNSISACTAKCDVSGSTDVGGFIGNSSGTIQNSNYEGSVNGTSQCTGGFVGEVASSATFTSCIASGKVTGKAYTGGFVGKVNVNSTFTSSNHYGTISGTSNVGGFAGYVVNSTITSSGHNGDITATGNYVSGLVGQVYATTAKIKINKSYSVGNINASGSYVGGIVGDFSGEITTLPTKTHIYSDSNYTPETEKYNYGGYKIVKCEYYKQDNGGSYYDYNRYNKYTVVPSGTTVELKFSNTSYSEGSTTAFPGYIILEKTYYKSTYNGYNNGYKWTGKLSSSYGCYAILSSSGTYDYCYACMPISTSLVADIQNNYFNGSITGKDYVGGVIGKAHTYSYDINIKNNYAYGDINGNQYVGGIIGHTSYDATAFTTTYRTLKSNVAINPTISSVVGDIGRIYGKVENGNINVGASGTSERNIALTTTKVSINGVPQNIDDNLQNGDSRGNSTLKYKATYQGIGWDFSNDWAIQETECYPYNPKQTAPPVFNSALTSGMTTISGKSVDGGTVYINVNGKEYTANVSSNTWSVTVPALPSGASVYAYAKASNLDYSYRTSTTVSFAGSGTEEDPYQVFTASDLANINSASYYKLMNDIDLTSYISSNSPTKGWIPVGRTSTAMSNFIGDGHKITGLWCNTTDDYTGLFASISNATITDLTIELASGKQMKSGSYTGILVGKQIGGTIKNCKVIGSVSGNDYTGGLAGYVDGVTIEKCSSRGNVSGKNYTAGLIGYTTNTPLTSVSANGNVNGTVNVAGITSNATTTLTKATYEGVITSTGASALVGGIVAKTTSSVTLATSKGSIKATGASAKATGIAAQNNGTVENCYSTMNVESTDYVAGVVAYNYGSVNKCYSSGNLSGTNIGAGVVGYNDGTSAKINNCFAINHVIDVASSTGIAMRVLGGYKNGASDPTTNNFAYKEMAVSVNNVAQKVYDDILNGIAKTDEVLKSSSTYSAQGWDFTSTWAIDEDNGYPYLLAEMPEKMAATSVILNKNSATLEVGQEVTLTATVAPEDATIKSVTWESTNPSVASVTDGKVTALAIGSTTITATTTDGTKLSASCKVTVTTAIIPATSVKLNKETSTVVVGKTITLTATVSPDNATAKAVTWSSDNESVATVAEGVVTALTTGVATITATTTDGSNISANCVITVIAGTVLEPTTDISMYSNVLYINDVEASQGAELTLPLNMKNAEENITAFECKVYLPEGVEWAITEDSRGNTIFVQPTFNEERTDADYHTISTITKKSDGGYYVIVYSGTNTNILKKEGMILNLPVVVSADIEPGEYNIFVKNIVMTNTDAQQVLIDKTVSKLTVPSYTIGDANDDGMINITDVVAVIAYMIEGNPNPFIFKAADVNCDEMINVTDVVGIINIMINEASNVKPEMAMTKKAVKKAAKTGNSLEIVPFTVAEGTTTQSVALELNNPGDEFTAFSCKVYLPEGMEWATHEDARHNIIYDMPTFNGNRTDLTYHTISAITKTSDGGYYIIVYSGNNEIILGEEGTILNLPITFKEGLEAGVYDIRISDITLTRPNVTQELLDDYTASVLVGSPEIASLSLNGDFTADAITEYNTALASNMKVAAMDFSNAMSIDAETKIVTGNKNLIVYVAEGKSVANEDNAVIGDECANLVLTDGYAFCAPKEFTAAKASYTRAATNGLGTLCLPFAAKSVVGSLYELTSAESNKLTFTPVEEVKGNTPYLYRSESAVIEETNAMVEAEAECEIVKGDWTMTGAYSVNVFSGEDNVFALYDGKLYKNTGTLTVNPFRVYFTTTGSASKAEIIIDTPTGISNVNVNDNYNYYNLNGVRVGKGYRGIVIRNGEKFIMK